MDYRDAFLNLLAILSYIDMDFDVREKEILADRVKKLYGHEYASALEWLGKRIKDIDNCDKINQITRESVEVIKQQLPQREWRNVVKELVHLTLADRNIDVAETAYLVNICRLFDVELDDVLGEIKHERGRA